MRKFKVGKAKLKGWWDKEVGKAIDDKKRENKKTKEFDKNYEKVWEEI